MTDRDPRTIESFIGEDTLAKIRQAEINHPETENTHAGGWCRHCGCGNDVLGYRHLRSCKYDKQA